MAIECYRAFHDVKMAGYISEISCVHKYLKLVDEKVHFEDIYSIELLDLGKK